ncbi:MAG: flavodoxin [Lachnospiraceae bacterium]|nr:flavodoxin [Lachnospiraceae bacterium]
MTIHVRYYSRGGNTKKLAECIAKAAGVQAQAKAIDSGSAETEQADILFLGASVYWGGIDNNVKAYIDQLDPQKVKKVAVFSTSALAQRAMPDIRKRLEKKGIPVADENFYCRGEFAALHKGHPDKEDLKAAEKFAREVLRK